MAKNRTGGPGAGTGSGARKFVLAIAALVVVGVVALLAARRSGEQAEAPVLSVADTEVAADAAAGTAIGAEDAPAVIIEFADFLCPHCRSFNAVTGRLLRQNYAAQGGKLRWVSYEFPLWPESLVPALAAQCAEEQGKYWEMHDLLFARVDSWRSESSPLAKFVGYARDLGMDGDEFEACVAERRTLPVVMASRKYGEELGVTGTPTLFVNGRRLEQTAEAYSYEGLERRILEAGQEGSAE